MGTGKALLAELVATFALITIGAGAGIASGMGAGFGILGVAFAHGLVLMGMIYSTGHISGGHINPAVTLGMMVTKKISVGKGIGYIIFQLIGAAIGGFVLMGMFPAAPASLHLGVTALAGGVTLTQGILVEAVLTFFLMFVIFGTAVDKRAPKGVYGAAIGLVLTFDIIVGGSLTGAAMNPARWFGPALTSGFWANALVYWIGPIIGAVAAALFYNHALLENKEGGHR